ncbi:hypothetical protein C789_1975 [Microcystis aeruginosa FACHB-905 = DIANCHI905]|nr:hypothetical protein C789_1975 [Microcystis aeruginosa FACHB-905 = DIANCHI905]
MTSFLLELGKLTANLGQDELKAAESNNQCLKTLYLESKICACNP